jgi:hypothetical protein
MFGDDKHMNAEIGEKAGMAPRVIMHLFNELGKLNLNEQEEEKAEELDGDLSESDTLIGDIEQSNSVFVSIL